MGVFWFLIYAFISIALVSQVLLWNFMELRNKKHKEENDVNTSSPPASASAKEEEAQPPPADASINDINVEPPPPPRPKRKKKDGEGSTPPTPVCRFCNLMFTSPQALGGHMNRHRGEREKEEFKKAEILIHTKGQNFALGYASGGAPSYFQAEGNYGTHYQGGGPQMANTSMMGNMGGGLQQQVYQNSNQQQFVGAPQMNPNYGPTHQQTAQASYQSQPPHHGGSYVSYNQSDNAPGRPPHVQGGAPQTSYTPRPNSGQYQAQGPGSLRDARPYAIPHGSSSTGVAHHQSNPAFTGHNNLSQAAGGAHTPTVDNIAALGNPAGSNANALRQSSATNQAVAQFVDQCGNIIIPGPSSGYSTGLRPLNPSHFQDNVQATEYDSDGPRRQDHYTGSQASYAGVSVHGTSQVQRDQYNAAAVGMENQYHASGVGMLSFEDADEEDEFGNGSPDLSTVAVTESGHGGGGVSTGRSGDARFHLRN